MMSKKNYEQAAQIAQGYSRHYGAGTGYEQVVNAFVTLFKADGNPRFDEERFRRACLAGANVKAR